MRVRVISINDNNINNNDNNNNSIQFKTALLNHTSSWTQRIYAYALHSANGSGDYYYYIITTYLPDFV